MGDSPKGLVLGVRICVHTIGIAPMHGVFIQRDENGVMFLETNYDGTTMGGVALVNGSYYITVGEAATTDVVDACHRLRSEMTMAR